MTRAAPTAIAALLSLALASAVAHAQAETATYTITFEGLWTVDDITDSVMPAGAHFTQVSGRSEYERCDRARKTIARVGWKYQEE